MPPSPPVRPSSCDWQVEALSRQLLEPSQRDARDARVDDARLFYFFAVSKLSRPPFADLQVPRGGGGVPVSFRSGLRRFH